MCEKTYKCIYCNWQGKERELMRSCDDDCDYCPECDKSDGIVLGDDQGERDILFCTNCMWQGYRRDLKEFGSLSQRRKDSFLSFAGGADLNACKYCPDCEQPEPTTMVAPFAGGFV
ncbi:hypothetical protein CBF23_003285 [Marinomonas agarivorans]|nr:hypothetical protein CBF23_003285 [Marinomonas agarivorans]